MPNRKLVKQKLDHQLGALRAEERFFPSWVGTSKDQLRRAIQALQIHQVELERQNRELQETRQELERSRDRYADLYDFAPVPYVTICEKGMIREINLTGARLLGMERGYLIGKPFALWIKESDIGKFMGHLARCRRELQDLLDTIDLQLPGGVLLPVQMRCASFQKGDSCETCLRVAIIDLSDRKRAEQDRSLLIREQNMRVESEASNRSKDEFLAILSHELRTPLQSMLSWVELLRTKNLSPKQIDRGLEIIHQSARVQQQLISDLLDVSRATAGKIQLELQPVDFPALIRQTLEALREQLEQKKIQIELDLNASAATIPGDPLRLQQIISNLLSNSLKFTSEGGTFFLRLTRTGESGRPFVLFSLTDTGKGIKACNLAHIFDRFRQEDSSITRPHAGLGLGLSIVRILAELHGGSVVAESPGEGRGATITVRLPASSLLAERPEKSDHPQAQTSEDDFADLSGQRILLVDDDLTTLESLRAVLEQCGARVSTASSAELGRERLRNERPDLLVGDIGLPVEDGFSMIRSIRALGDSFGGDTPAIALTAFAGSDEQRRALAAGYQTFVAKPVRSSELTQAIARLLR